MLKRELLDAEHRVAERPELGVDKWLMAPLGAAPLDSVALTVRYAPITTQSALQEHLDVFFGRELPLQVFAQACLVARDDEIVSSDDRHTTIFHDSPDRSRLAEPSERPSLPPGFFGKPAGVSPLLPRGFRKLGIFCSGVLEAGLVRGWPEKGAAWLRACGQPFGAAWLRACGQPFRAGGHPLGWCGQGVQKALGGEGGGARPAGRVLDPRGGAADARAAPPLPRQAHELVVGGVGRPREDRPDPPLGGRAAGDPRSVEDHRELVARIAVSARQQMQERPPSGLEALGLVGPEIRLAPDDVVAVDEPPHVFSIPRPTAREGDSWQSRSWGYSGAGRC